MSENVPEVPTEPEVILIHTVQCESCGATSTVREVQPPIQSVYLDCPECGAVKSARIVLTEIEGG